MRKINGIYEKVTEALRNNEALRKSDLALTMHVYSDMLHRDVSKMQFKTVCSLIEDGELPPFDSIRRARCKAQELFPELIDIPTQIKRTGKMKDYIQFSRKTTY